MMAKHAEGYGTQYDRLRYVYMLVTIDTEEYIKRLPYPRCCVGTGDTMQNETRGSFVWRTDRLGEQRPSTTIIEPSTYFKINFLFRIVSNLQKNHLGNTEHSYILSRFPLLLVFYVSILHLL